MNLVTVFKAYDVRGIYPSEFNEETAAKIAQAYVAIKQPKKIVIGQDVRNSGKKIKQAMIESLLKSGVDVVDIGVITTDQLYFAVAKYKLSGGISVTASHNPAEYNGLKFAEVGGAPIESQDLIAMRTWITTNSPISKKNTGKYRTKNILNDYVTHVLTFINPEDIKPMSVLANANFGAVGRSVDQIAKKLNLKLNRLNWKEDGSFPKGPPNPLLPENRAETIQKIKKIRPDIGVAWDADADRCFFFTENGEFIPSCYILSLLSKYFLNQYPGSKIVHDVTTSWVIDDSIRKSGGQPITNRTGHTFIKARMRKEDAIFAGESSGHYYFKDNFYADNGIIPLLLLLQIMSKEAKSLSQLVAPLMAKYKVSGEINFKVKDPVKVLKLIETKIGHEGKIDRTDGLVIETKKWRFSARPSNTEPLFRLNAESKNQNELEKIVSRISSLIAEN